LKDGLFFNKKLFAKS